MNHIYRTLWNEVLGTWVAVPELTKAKGKRSRSVKASTAAGLGIALVATLPHFAMAANFCQPSGGSVSCGQISGNSVNYTLLGDITTSGKGLGIVVNPGKAGSGRAGALFVPPGSGKDGNAGTAEMTKPNITSKDDGTFTFTYYYKDQPNKVAQVITYEAKDPENMTDGQDTPYVQKVVLYDLEGKKTPLDDKPITATVAMKGESIKLSFINGTEVTFSPDGSGVEASNGVASNQPVVTQLDGNGKTLTTNLSSVDNASAKAGVYAVSHGGEGGNGGTYYLGGKGKPGGDGANAANAGVSVKNITISVTNGTGVLAESSGGDGGEGGGSHTVVANAGSGGLGGNGGNANVHLNGSGGKVTIKTSGDNAAGVLALSQGGKGGSSGPASGIVASGGKGNSAGGAQNASVTANGDVTINTTGKNSSGIVAQSVGGSGGKGGTTVGLVGLGGKGGSGGNAGAVSVNSEASIHTQGELSSGILAQSLGGGGGNGGTVVGLAALGSSGNAGGDAGKVSVINNGRIVTEGRGASGIMAQSIGGGGGNSGMGVGLMTIGGDSEDGGLGKDVSVINKAQSEIITKASEASGITAQSIGGGGGNGGLALGAVAIGGKGGKGNHAGNVEVINEGNIATGYDFKHKVGVADTTGSHGIFAQSIGGGGGNGSAAISVAPVLSLTIGGEGAEAGNAGEVDVSVAGRVETYGHSSSGIMAQSLGGGGGNGGLAGSLTSGIGVSASVTLGGGGGGGGEGKSVNVVTNSGAITTHGDRSTGITAQSIGGGGGDGGVAVAFKTASVVSVGVTLGGKGGAGNKAGEVTVENSAAINTSGMDATGILAQSVGGGGGSGGLAVSGSVGTASSVDMAVGGSGGEGAQSALSSVINYAQIATKGDSSSAIISQSIGGGGGNAGGSIAATAGSLASVNLAFGGKAGKGGEAGEAKVENHADLFTKGKNAAAIIAQSIAGHGGNGGFAGAGGISTASANLTLGGKGGEGGSAGDTSVASEGVIYTEGENASGIVAQSLGGSGGNGGVAVSATAGGSMQAKVALGGGGGTGGKAGEVAVKATQAPDTAKNVITLSTQKDNSSGIVAQSIGGQGGNGGLAVVGGVATSGVDMGLSLGGGGGKGAQAKKVTVETDHFIDTKGDNSAGIVAQSIGGHGGNGGFAVSGSLSAPLLSAQVALGGDGGEAGLAGDVTVTTKNSIRTAGANSAGVVAQSLGGGGGNGGFSVGAGLSTGLSVGVSMGGQSSTGGMAGNVALTLGVFDEAQPLAPQAFDGGLVQTLGHNSIGALAQSIGGQGGNGGFSVAAGASVGLAAASAAVSLGGSGSDGGRGQDVRLNANQQVLTEGDNSSGLQAQSIGGSGGAGGFSMSGAAAAAAKGPAVAVTVALGGSGGQGGHAGNVVINSAQSIQTKGHGANGIVAQSIAGNGGSGGVTGAASLSGSATAASISAGVAIGGGGGKGGSAGKVAVNVAPGLDAMTAIMTAGDHAAGIVAQSLGGSGGVGGASFSGTVAVNPSAAISLGAAVGGSGGLGGHADEVAVNNHALIQTKGDYAYGILAQSINGDGGAGGLSAALSGAFSGKHAGTASVSIGGEGGGHAYRQNAQKQLLDAQGMPRDSMGYRLAAKQNEGDPDVYLNRAGQVLVQKAGDSQNWYVKGSNVRSQRDLADGDWAVPEASMTVANHVAVTNHGHIATGGDFADGIAAQSIGGNGGVGGLSIAGGLSVSPKAGVNAGVAIGGGGGNGGRAGTVTVDNTNAAIQTKGHAANGIAAQSLGGNGGNGGMAIAGGLTLSTEAAVALTASVGGQGGVGNRADKVTVTSDNSDIMSNDEGQNVWTMLTEGDEANGILAQSIGGGGGNGGIAGSVSVALTTGGPAVAASVAIGGGGGSGNRSDDVGVSSKDNISTTGQGANGILAQSIGGGGGNGGFGLAVTLSGNASDKATIGAAVSLGGKGGAGNRAGAVDVASSGIVHTQGDYANGVAAQSIGGGGGNGGMAIGADVLLSPKGFGINVGIGGFGGDAGRGDDVSVTRSGDIKTQGQQSAGIMAQSIGGGGGNGGAVITATAALMNAKTATFSLGGFGGDGNTAGAVKVDNVGNVETEGERSQGILAQSIGGGGGNGGFSSAVSIDAISTKSSLAFNAAVGGFGGTGALSDRVDVASLGSIWTKGDGAQGILAQSIGGGGGNGGSSLGGVVNTGGIGKEGKATTINVAVGGFGGSGNRSDEVAVAQTGLIQTEGFGASGIQAQSIGGGGGNGGNATGKTLSLDCGDTCKPDGKDKKKDLHITASIGGWAGSGNDAGRVDIDNIGHIVTAGDAANGIYAQSIGGGGGDGGNAMVDAKTYTIDKLSEKAQTLTLGIGGYQGSAGEAGAVAINHLGSITTKGNNAKGILAQSIGGGGGNGGSASGSTVGVGGGAFQSEISHGINGLTEDLGIQEFLGVMADGSSGNGAAVTVATGQFSGLNAPEGALIDEDELQLIYTVGERSDAIFAQSIGGGGGIGGSASGKLAVGGDGGLGGNGGAVTVNNDLLLHTQGLAANGIFAQSIGGGGGVGGDVADKATIGIGGSGTMAGNGGAIEVANLGQIVTEGDLARGIVAQSIGGGGGAGGSVDQATVAIGGGALSTLLGAVGDDHAANAKGGHGDAVSVVNGQKNTMLASIVTKGQGADAIVAQSIGGGGGIGGNASGKVAIGGMAAGAGHAGKVDVTNYALLATQGDSATGIIAQSIGGGGGLGGSSKGIDDKTAFLAIGGSGATAGHAGDVTIDNTGLVIMTEGEHSRGLLAQSIGGGGGAGGSSSGYLALGGGALTDIIEMVSNGGALAGGHAAGGNAGKVSIHNGEEGSELGAIVTQGDGADAIVAQSIAGGGGVGGNANGLLALGGAGSVAGASGHVDVSNHAMLATKGEHASGIIAQSIGGGGGVGGSSNGLDDKKAIVAIGGSGASAGHGSEVNIFNTGKSIVTEGAFSRGLLAQSIGGGGGAGGSSSGYLALGGGALGDIIDMANQGGVSHGGNAAGGNAAAVSIENGVAGTDLGTILTRGEGADAIVAQSIAGGGGVGGNANGYLALGGAGSVAGTAGAVDIANHAMLATKGHNASGIIAQSIGGGGGVGGSSKGLDDKKAILAIGGSGSHAGHGSEVNILNGGKWIMTEGEHARGLLAQSIGGGGGAGGSSSGYLALGGGALGDIIDMASHGGVSNGGSAAGGNAAAVRIDNGEVGTDLGVIMTQGMGADAIVAQSIGGGGGVGGNAQGLLALGGAGSVAGHSGQVDVSNHGLLATKGDHASGIVAQSVGGGGGIGGSSNGFGDNKAIVAIGGHGSSASHGSAVSILNAGIILTEGHHSRGLLAQSIGGGGGAGGSSNGYLALGGGALGGIINRMSHGGVSNGGDAAGGDADSVSIQNGQVGTDLGMMITLGDGADAIVAQSIAGGGGVGGNAQGLLALGGAGSVAGTASTVDVGNHAVLATKGHHASGIIAQSIGGGGGVGGSSHGVDDHKAILAIGGSGSGAGHGGAVDLFNTGKSIVTEGDFSRGLLAQSIGGGGGVGGSSSGYLALGSGALADLMALATGTATMAPAVAGGDAAAVSVVNGQAGSELGTIMTLGQGADAIVAQSIAGGGGVGGTANGLLALGGHGSVGGEAGAVSIINDGLLITKGNRAAGIVAQSIAGGGGIAGVGAGVVGEQAYISLGGYGATDNHAAAVSVLNRGKVVGTSGDYAQGILAQSIANGGGFASGISKNSRDTEARLGSHGGTGHAGEVSLNNQSLVVTTGVAANALVAQSIGGGGGLLAGSVGQAYLGAGYSPDELNDDEDAIDSTVGSHGARVSISNRRDLATTGEASSAIVAQSIGGGGGLIAGAQTVEYLFGAVGDAGAVTVTNATERVSTIGRFAHGVIAQSIAGGGGYVTVIDEHGRAVGYAAGSTGGHGVAGDVVIAQSGHITTSGYGSYALYGQSSGSQNGDVRIDVAQGNLIVGGSGPGAAVGLYDGGHNVVDNKGLMTAQGTQLGLRLVNGKQLQTAGWLDGNIVTSGSGNDSVHNRNQMTGSVSLGSGNNHFVNHKGAWLVAGQTMHMNEAGAALLGQADNFGHFAIGGINRVDQTALLGNFEQHDSGMYYWDYDLDRVSQVPTVTPAVTATSGARAMLRTVVDQDNALPQPEHASVGSADAMTVSGGAKLGGTLTVNLLSPDKATPGVSDLLMIAAGEVGDKGLVVTSVPSAVAKFDKVMMPKAAWVRSTIDYSPKGLTENGHSVGNAVNAIQTDQTSPRFGPIAAALLYRPDVAALQKAYDAISGEGNVGIQDAAFTYGHNLMRTVGNHTDFWRTRVQVADAASYASNCAEDGGVDAEGQSLLGQDCNQNDSLRVWLFGSKSSNSIKPNGPVGTGHYHANNYSTTLGMDYRVGSDAIVGLAFGDGHASYNVYDRATSGDVKAKSVMLYGAKTYGSAYLNGMLGYDWIDAETRRFAMVEGSNEPINPVAGVANQLEGEFKARVVNARLESGYQFAFEALNFTPFGGVQASAFNMKAADERAKGDNNDLALQYHRKNVYSVPVYLGLQLDKTIMVPNGGVFQPYARVAVAHNFATKRAMDANFTSAPGYVFEIKGALADKTSTEVNLGFNLMPSKSFSLYGQFNGRYSKKGKNEGGTVGLNYRW